MPASDNIVMMKKSKCLSGEIIKPRTTWDNIFNPKPDYFNDIKFLVELNGSCLTPKNLG